MSIQDTVAELGRCGYAVEVIDGKIVNKGLTQSAKQYYFMCAVEAKIAELREERIRIEARIAELKKQRDRIIGYIPKETICNDKT